MNHTSKVEIVPYDASWPMQFELMSVKLSRCLHGLVTSIDHIGSTSVPNLSSKKRIDIQVTVEILSEEFKSKLDHALNQGGFPSSSWNEDHLPPFDSQERDQWKKLYMSVTDTELGFRSNIHFRVRNHANHRYALLFRDYLRQHPESAKAYQKLKEELVRFQMNDSIAYSEIKDPVCDLIMVEARKWAMQTEWRAD